MKVTRAVTRRGTRVVCFRLPLRRRLASATSSLRTLKNPATGTTLSKESHCLLVPRSMSDDASGSTLSAGKIIVLLQCVQAIMVDYLAGMHQVDPAFSRSGAEPDAIGRERHQDHRSLLIWTPDPARRSP